MKLMEDDCLDFQLHLHKGHSSNFESIISKYHSNNLDHNKFSFIIS
jgi:hypothetical protein